MVIELVVMVVVMGCVCGGGDRTSVGSKRGWDRVSGGNSPDSCKTMGKTESFSSSHMAPRQQAKLKPPGLPYTPYFSAPLVWNTLSKLEQLVSKRYCCHW